MIESVMVHCSASGHDTLAAARVLAMVASLQVLSYNDDVRAMFAPQLLTIVVNIVRSVHCKVMFLKNVMLQYMRKKRDWVCTFVEL